jgi:hypothetical protein
LEPKKLSLYEAWISRGMVNRAVEVRAAGIREAYAEALKLCEEGEVLRGVSRIDETAGLPI